MQNEAVRVALESGEWCEKKDSKSGKTYYVNVKTRTSVWNLKKELAKLQQEKKPAAGTASGQDKGQDLTRQRQAQAIKWQEEEAELKRRITELDREKAKLESEIAVLQEPTEAEAAALEEEQSRLLDAKQAFELAVANELRKRQEETAELQELQVRLEALRRERRLELGVLDALQGKLDQLELERAESLADLRREETAEEQLQEELCREERRLEEALREESRIKQLLGMRENEVDRMKAELKVICERGAELRRCHQQLAEEVTDTAMMGCDNDEKTNVGETFLEADTSLGPLLLSHLQQEVARRKSRLQQLKRQENLWQETGWMATESTELRRLTQLAERKARELAQFSEELSDQVRVVMPLVKAIASDVQQLEKEEAEWFGSGKKY